MTVAAALPRSEPAIAGGTEALLACEGIDTFYGETQVLFDVSLRRRAGRGGRAARPERRRQDHDAALDPRPDAGPSAAASASTGRDITHWPTHGIARAGIGWVPDDRRIFPTLTVARNLSIAPEAHALPRLEPEGDAARSSRRSTT